MKKLTLALTALCLALLCACAADPQTAAPEIEPPSADVVKTDPDALKTAAVAYLESTRPTKAEAPLFERDETTGMVTLVYEDYERTIDRAIAFLQRAPEVRYVEKLPELTAPVVRLGGKMKGNHEKLYHSTSDGIVEFTLREEDALGFFLFLGEHGPVYPEAREAFAEVVIQQLQEGLAYEDQDAMTFVNGTLFQLDIRTRETAEQLFACIRNCTSVFDYTDLALETMDLKIRMNGYQASFQKLFIRYKETGQLFGINFSEEDSEALYEYVMNLQ